MDLLWILGPGSSSKTSHTIVPAGCKVWTNKIVGSVMAVMIVVAKGSRPMMLPWSMRVVPIGRGMGLRRLVGLNGAVRILVVPGEEPRVLVGVDVEAGSKVVEVLAAQGAVRLTGSHVARPENIHGFSERRL